MQDRNQPVFYDPRGVRSKRTKRASFIIGSISTVLVLIAISSVLVNPFFPKVNLRPIAGLPSIPDAKPQLPPKPVPPGKQKIERSKNALTQVLSKTRVPPARRPSQIKVTAPPPAVTIPVGNTQTKPLSIGFYVNWDDSSYESLKRNLGQLDWVIPEWLRMQDGPDPLIREVDPKALDLMRRVSPKTPILPMIHNSTEGVFDPGLLSRSIADAASRTRLANALTQFVQENSFGGICLDFEEVPAESQDNLLAFIKELHSDFQPHGWIVTQNLPFDDPSWNYAAYVSNLDYVMLMAYDQHWTTSQPGDIAGLDWFQSKLAERMRVLPANKTIINIGGYGYDWVKGGDTNEVTFQAAILSARDSLDSLDELHFDQPGLNPHFSYIEEDGSQHTVWFLDAVTAYNQIKAARAYNPSGFALWRLGSEDPSLWSIFGSAQMDNAPSNLGEIKSGYDVDFEGDGEILQVDPPQDGARDIKIDPDTGFISSELYTKVPSSYVVRRTDYRPGEVALTFDDGPDPIWTPKILDILKEKNVHATFFIIGRNGEDHPELLRRTLAEGNDIGNHTFTHPNLGEIPKPVMKLVTDLELTTTQRLIESVTGRSTILFRPPYFGDAEPSTPDEVEPAVIAKDLGYIIVGLRADAEDWKRPGVDAIVNKTIASVTDPDPERRGQIILLHDSGGDREQTVEALPLIIDQLRARGFRFVTASELAGMSRDQAMPPLSPNQNVFARSNAITIYVVSIIGWILHWIFWIGIVLGIGRLLFIGSLALAQWMRSRKRDATHAGIDYNPFVSIIVPAYNEEKVIASTIESLLASTYQHFEIIVVDDGSPDKTSEVVRERFGNDPRVQLFTKENAGKAEALNYGLKRCKGAVIVALDADTIFTPETIGALAHRFYDKHIGAIAGNAKVGNRINLLTRWQALEYITSQNMDRRAFASLNCITVVPGAVGAWRRDLLEQADGFASDTLAEDQDLTLKVRKLGYKIGYEENAVAWTEAPDTARALAKQRFRWSYGTLQCMWKHRNALFNPKYGALGFVAMPNVWVFQVLFPLISPIMDLTLIYLGVRAILEKIASPEYSSGNFEQVLFYYCLFLAIDWIGAAFAFMMEKRESWGLLAWLFLQRFCYRQIMYYVMIKSVYFAIRGAIVGWGKLERKATVEARP
ncbi:MAG TPA: glycosyltransferase [Blastocatellia bacterium]|nr:glycosyltransferase [Blastocatellia bacterium]